MSILSDEELQGIAKRHAANAPHSYAQGAALPTWKAHDWVIAAMREAMFSGRGDEEAKLKRLADDALAALAGAGIATPEKGYMAEPHCLSGDIGSLARERDRLRERVAWIESVLEDPHAVRINILRGQIKVPSDLVWLHDTNGPVAQAINAAREEQREACAKRIEWAEPMTVHKDTLAGLLDIVRNTPLELTPLTDALEAARDELDLIGQAVCGMFFDVERQKVEAQRNSTCAFCNASSPLENLQAHMLTCAKHPLGRLVKALQGLVLARDATWSGGHDWEQALVEANEVLADVVRPDVARALAAVERFRSGHAFACTPRPDGSCSCGARDPQESQSSQPSLTREPQTGHKGGEATRNG